MVCNLYNVEAKASEAQQYFQNRKPIAAISSEMGLPTSTIHKHLTEP